MADAKEQKRLQSAEVKRAGENKGAQADSPNGSREKKRKKHCEFGIQNAEQPKEEKWQHLEGKEPRQLIVTPSYPEGPRKGRRASKVPGGRRRRGRGGGRGDPRSDNRKNEDRNQGSLFLERES